MSNEMYPFNYDKICRPALVYFVIAVILALITLFLGFSQGTTQSTWGNFSSQFLSIILCTFILMGICSFYPPLSWAFVILFILCNLSALSAFFGSNFRL